MRMIGKTSETLLGLPSWAMAYLCYLVLRTRKENSSANGWYHCTTTKAAVKNSEDQVEAEARKKKKGSQDQPVRRIGVEGQHRRTSRCGGLWRRRQEHAWTHRGIAPAGNPDSGADGTGEYSAAETSDSCQCASWSVWKGSHALSRKRYDDRTLGNGGRVAVPGVPGLQKWIPEGIDRRI